MLVWTPTRITLPMPRCSKTLQISSPLSLMISSSWIFRVSIWDFHGAADSNVPVAGSRQMYTAIHAAGGSSCYTEFPGLEHDIWNTVQVYADPAFQAWIFSQTRAPSRRSPPRSCTGLTIHGIPAQ